MRLTDTDEKVSLIAEYRNLALESMFTTTY